VVKYLGWRQPRFENEGRIMAESSAKILIAEDHPQGAELLEAYLSGTPYEMRTAMNGEEALRTILEWRPDVVLLDIMMPRLSGFEVCKRLRQSPATRDIGVIMITALGQPADVDRAVDAGTDDFLTKPINQAELLIRIRAILKSRKQQGDLPRALDYIRAVDQVTA
jgi:two-component system alkaline phosphatase synthesis response regulator PhoP